MTKTHENCQSCGLKHRKNALTWFHGKLLCHNCKLKEAEIIPGKIKISLQSVKTSERPNSE